MYGVKIKNIDTVYNKAKRFIELKAFLDLIISDKYFAYINIKSRSNLNSTTGSIGMNAVALISVIQKEIHELGTELKEFGVDLEES